MSGGKQPRQRSVTYRYVVRLLAVLALLVASSTMLGGASAATSHVVAKAGTGGISADLDTGSNGSGSSALPPPAVGGQDSAAIVEGTSTIAKAKTTITLPTTLLRTYANNEFVITKDHHLNSSSPAWAVTRTGKHPRFGTLPPAHTTVLAFGAIPVTATIELSQLIVKHLITPLVVTTSGLIVFPYTIKPAVVSGPVELRVTNIKVDRVPLKVGSNCHTVRPLQLRLIGDSPGYNLFTGGPLHQTDLVVPPFAGCRNGTEDVSRLLTEMISGPGNALSMRQGLLGAWDAGKGDCADCVPPAG